jgi:DNA-binding GntR family transcriptional regulator
MPKFEAKDEAAGEAGGRPKARYKFQPGRLKLSVAEARQPLATASLHDQLVARLREMVLEGELAPGTPLPEKMLCETFGVSRTPLREAFKVLATEGLMELRPHRTPIVTPVARDEIAAVFEVSIALDRLAAALACARATPSERAALDALHADLAGHHRSGERRAYFRLNQEIHAEIVRLAGNPVLTATWTSLSAKIYRARAQVNYVGSRWDDSFDEHEHFMAHFRRVDADAFAEAMAAHTRMTAAAVLAGLDAAPAAGDAA